MAEETPQLGFRSMKSRRWWVSYNGGVNLGPRLAVGGVHQFIFRGDDSLTGAVVELTGVGLEVNWGVKRFGKRRSGGTGTQPPKSNGDQDVIESAEDALNYKDAVDDYVALRNNPAPWCNMSNVTLLTAKNPFSIDDLGKAWGGIQGMVQVGGYIAGGAALKINASLSTVSAYREGDPNTLFEDWPVFNVDGGSVGVGFAFLQGKWSIKGAHGDIYTSRCPIKNGPGLEKLISSDPKLQNLPNL